MKEDVDPCSACSLSKSCAPPHLPSSWAWPVAPACRRHLTTVRCSAEGVTRRAIGTRFYPRDAIATLRIKPVAGIGGSRAEIELQLKDGSRIPLDATLVVRSGPDHAELKARITEMQALLRL